MSRRTYTRFKCEYCGKEISTAGAAKHAHYLKHYREGWLTIETIGNRHIGYRYLYIATEDGLIVKQVRKGSDQCPTP